MIEIEQLLILFILFEIKHFVFDGLLQNEYHLGKFKEKFWDYVLPLIDHSMRNASGAVFAIFIYDVLLQNGDINPNYYLILYIVELILHFVIDRIKASPKLLGRYNDKGKRAFWDILMLDQMLHRLCYIGYIYLLIRI